MSTDESNMANSAGTNAVQNARNCTELVQAINEHYINSKADMDQICELWSYINAKSSELLLQMENERKQEELSANPTVNKFNADTKQMLENVLKQLPQESTLSEMDELQRIKSYDNSQQLYKKAVAAIRKNLRQLEIITKAYRNIAESKDQLNSDDESDDYTDEHMFT